jgi:hypothetical protein
MGWVRRSASFRKYFAVVAVVVLTVGGSWPGFAQSGGAEFAPFLGRYSGQTVFASNKGLTLRDLDVVITRDAEGFAVGWTTVTQKPSGKVTRKNYITAFRPTEKQGVYLPANQVQGVRLDPLKGDPRVWARVKGDTLSVYAVIITEDGGYEMQTYDRKLVPGGMELNFSRVRDGKELKGIRAHLEVVTGTKGGRR